MCELYLTNFDVKFLGDNQTVITYRKLNPTTNNFVIQKTFEIVDLKLTGYDPPVAILTHIWSSLQYLQVHIMGRVVISCINAPNGKLDTQYRFFKE